MCYHHVHIKIKQPYITNILKKVLNVYCKLLKQGHGNQCRTPGVQFESPVEQSCFGDILVLVTYKFWLYFSFGENSVNITF